MSVDFGTGSMGHVSVPSGGSQTLAPGSYGNWSVNSAGTLTLRGGKYYVNSFQFNSGSRVLLDASSGPVYIYVRGDLALRGTFAPKRAAEGLPRLLVASFGTNPVQLESPAFAGALLAPRTKVNVQSGGPFSGQVVAKDIEVFADRSWSLTAFGSWDSVFDPLPREEPILVDEQTLESLLPADAVGAAILNYATLASENSTHAELLAAVQAMKAQPRAALAAALTDAFRRSKSPVMKHIFVDIAADIRLTDIVPLLTEVLSPSLVPSPDVMRSWGGHGREFVQYVAIANGSLRGLSALVAA
jgi:hypothetical protein